MSDCLHCDINQLVQERIDRGDVDLADLTSMIAEALADWILAAPELAHRMWRLNDLFAATAAHPAERMSVMAFDHLDQFRNRACGLLTTNRALLDSFLDSRDDLECFRPPAGSVVFPRLPRGIEPEKFFQLLREKYETSVVPGRFFEMPQYFRLGIGGPTGELRPGLERLGAALDEVTA